MKRILFSLVLSLAVLLPARAEGEPPRPAPARVEPLSLRHSSIHIPRERFFIACGDEGRAQELAAALPEASFLVKGMGYEHAFPARLRPVRHAEALEHWGDFCQACPRVRGFGKAAQEQREAMKRELEADPQGTVADTFVADIPAFAAGETMQLVLPGLGAWSADKGAYRDRAIGFELPRYYPDFYHEPEMAELGHYRLFLSTSAPIAADDLEAALAGTPVSISPSNRKDTWYALPYVGGGVWQGSFPDGTGATVLRLDRESTERTAREVLHRDGTRVKGYLQIHFTAETDGERVYLNFPLALPSVYGHKGIADNGRHNRHVMIPASKPYIVSSLRAHGLREGGRRELLYRCGWLQSLQARVRRVACTGAAPVQLLERYEKEYLSTDQRPEAHWQNGMRERGEAIPQPSIMDTTNLGGELRECPLERPARGEQGHFDPTSLFTAQPPQGMYVVELVGVPDDARRAGKLCIAQSVVQVTDLGLVWRQSSKGELLAFAYRLSDSAPLPEGTLRLMDAQGSTLAEYAVADGLAQGALCEGTLYLQLASGEDAYTISLKEEPAVSRWAPPPPTAPRALGFFFTDRRLYQPNEVVHVGGMVRCRDKGRLVLPEAKEAVLEYSGGSVPVTFDANGCFAADLRQPEGSAEGIEGFTLCFTDQGVPTRLRHDEFSVSPLPSPSATLDGTYGVQDEMVRAGISARRADGSPLAGSGVELDFQWVPVNFFPRGFENYRFGDFRLVPHTQAGYKAGPAEWRSFKGQLDADGSYRVQFTLPQNGYPRPMKVDFYAKVQADGRPAIAQHKELVVLDRSALYIGLLRQSQLTRAGEDIALDLLLVGADGRRYEGEPVEVELTCVREDISAARLGRKLVTSRRSSEVHRQALRVPAEGCAATIPTEKVGQYIIAVQGKDAEGRAFATIVRQYVWDDSGNAPWMRNDDDSLELMPDKKLYRAGETARVMVATELEGEAHVVVSSQAGSRAWHAPVSAGQRFIEVPLTAADGEGATLDLTLVQGAGPRPPSGLPLIQGGRCELHLERRARQLAVQVDAPARALKPGERCEFTGSVRDEQGKPVAGASVIAYAVDAGTATRRRYWVTPDVQVKEQGTGEAAITFMDADSLPELMRPQDFFHPRRYAYATLHSGKVMGDLLDNWEFGNKGVFVGAHGEEGAPQHEAPALLPCALWQKLTTDGQGRFRASFTAPAVPAAYRLMAVACSGAEQFGSAAVDIEVEPEGATEPAAGAYPEDEEI